ncbi:hypothetical protein ACFW16_33945 [Inquilinus sp. NPDC058860]|uniref:hypothetical protein n=1 Tax=Inquilinus sp. NPDC058860 TaxID=3346652 RepID=UPI00368C9BFF
MFTTFLISVGAGAMVQGININAASGRMEIIKASGGLVKNEALAKELAAALWRSRFGADALAIQEPLRVEDQGDRWRIVGSAAGDLRSLPPVAPMVVVIAKADGQVLDLTMGGIGQEDPGYPLRLGGQKASRRQETA